MVLWVNEMTSTLKSAAAISQMQSRPAGFRQKTVSQLFNLHEGFIHHKVNATRIIVYNIDKNVLTALYKYKRK
jgi:hypothetical protein